MKFKYKTTVSYKMVVAVRTSSPIKGKVPKLSMLELVTLVNNRYKKTKLRKKVLPKAYCYVCSKVDPSGLFKHPNSYLYQKGFFHACEHFPKAPYSTFVEDESQRDATAFKSVAESSKAAPPSFTVTIHQGSSVNKSKLSSELRREQTMDSPTLDKNASRQSVAASRSADNKDDERDLGTNRNTTDSRIEKESDKQQMLSVPTTSFGRPEKSRSSRRSDSETYHKYSRKYSRFSKLETGHTSGLSDRMSETYPPSSRVTVIPTALNDEASNPSMNSPRSPLSHNKQSDISSVTFAKHSISRKSSYRSLDGVIQTKPYINESDGLGISFSQDHLVREVIYLDMTPRSGRSLASKTTKDRNKQYDSATDNSSDYRPESGHLRYHHRGDEDSVPYPGFEMPPTPSALEIREMERLEAEKRELQRQIELGNVFDNSSSKGAPGSIISDDASLTLASEQVKSRASGLTSGKHSFCRCSSYLRELSVTHTTCNTCGKILRQGSEAGCSRESTRLGKGRVDYDNASRSSLGSLASKSRQKMLLEGRRGKIKTVTDEDYMDLDSIIHEDETYYYSDNETASVSRGRSSELRYKNAKPFPLVDPEIHKIVYIKALQAAQYQKKPLVVGEQRLRKPHVFSYFHLWPFAAKRNPTAGNIGIHPEESFLPKKGKIMKHIFGNVKLDDYYPAAQSEFKAKKRVINDSIDKANNKTDSLKSSTKLPDIPPQSERSSVGLKMMKQSS